MVNIIFLPVDPITPVTTSSLVVGCRVTLALVMQIPIGSIRHTKVPVIPLDVIHVIYSVFLKAMLDFLNIYLKLLINLSLERVLRVPTH